MNQRGDSLWIQEDKTLNYGVDITALSISTQWLVLMDLPLTPAQVTRQLVSLVYTLFGHAFIDAYCITHAGNKLTGPTIWEMLQNSWQYIFLLTFCDEVVPFSNSIR